MQFQFDGFASFLAMNGHGPYVWASYAVAFLVLAALAITPGLRQKKQRQALERQLRQVEARSRAAAKRSTQSQPEPVE